jgi:purine-binding chemotaxis protein CheW
MNGSPQVVVLRCAHSLFGIPIEHVREIVMVPDVTPVPDSGEFIRGIINLRGRILPVLDLGLRLGLGPGPRDRSGRIVVVEPEPQQLLGLLVDEASEVLRLSESQLSPPPELLARSLQGSVRLVARLDQRLLLLLDLPRLLEPLAAGALQAAAAAEAAGIALAAGVPALAAEGATT